MSQKNQKSSPEVKQNVLPAGALVPAELKTPEQLAADAVPTFIGNDGMVQKKDRWPDRIKKSTVSSPVKMVWSIADEMIGQNPDVRRKDVVAECIKLGIAGYTARTQYQQWYTARRESMRAAAEIQAKQAAGK